MPIQLTCACGRSLTLPDASAGQRGRCPACGATLTFPALAPAPSAPGAAAGASPTNPPEQAAAGLALRASSAWAEAVPVEGGPSLPQRLTECAKCGQAVTGEGLFCVACGAPVVHGIAGAAGKLCPACHQLVPTGALVCIHCNARLTAAVPAPSKPVEPRASAPWPAPAAQPGLALAGGVRWVLALLLVVGLLLGGWGVTRFFKRMNFDAYVRDGDNCLFNGYPGEAETAYRRAQELYPDDPALPKKFEEVAAYRKWKEEMSLKGHPVGSMGLEMVNRMSEAERRQRDLEQKLLRPPPHK